MIRLFIWSLLAGLFAGGFIAFGGAIKDSLYEGFSYWKFVRSPIIAVIWSIVGGFIFLISDFFVLMGFCAGLERITIEIYKIVIRKKPLKFSYAEGK